MCKIVEENLELSMYMYGGGVHSVRPLDGAEFNPCSLHCRFINLVIDNGVCVVLYDGLELEEQLESEELWTPPVFADLGAGLGFAAAGLAKGDDLVSAVVLNPVLS